MQYYKCFQKLCKIPESHICSDIKYYLSFKHAHTKVTQPKYQGNALIDSQGKAVTTESVNFVAHADKVHSAPAKTKKIKWLTPYCQTLSS